MSVNVLDLKAYDAVYRKAWAYGFNRTLDINYCNTLSYGNDDALKEVIKDWLWLNEYSWIRRYSEPGVPDMAPFLTFKTPGEAINTYQMLKYLEHIAYNIEIGTIKTGCSGMEDPIVIPTDKMDSYNTLLKAIEEIKTMIIREIPEYNDAKWG